MNQFMIEMQVPVDLTQEFINLIPAQRLAVDELLSTGKITGYTLNAERTRLWVTMNTKDEDEVIQILESLPLTCYMDYEIHELMFHQTMQTFVPPVSMN